jgi:leucyl/phenylalanyl-tRNA--protein transferase
MLIFQLKEEVEFPNTRRVEPDGLFAVGGDLSTNRLIVAYKLGIFPWFSEGMPLLWWQPDLRMVLFPNEFKRQKSLRKIVEKSMFRVTFNQNFKKVIM